MKLATKKAYSGVKAAKFLGHRDTADGLAPDPGNVEVLTKMPMPTNVSQLNSVVRDLFYTTANFRLKWRPRRVR